MPHVNPTLPNDGETADAGDISIPFLALLAIFNGHIGPDNLEPGSMPWSIMSSFTDSIPASAMKDSGNLEMFLKNAKVSFVLEGLIWAALTGRNGSMTSGKYYSPDGMLLSDVPEITSRTFDASRDTYVAIDKTGSISYHPVNNGANRPSLPTDNTWLARVVTNASTITSVVDMRRLSPFGSRLVVKRKSLPIPSGDLAPAGNVFYKEVNMGLWPDAGFATLLGVFTEVNNRQYWSSSANNQNTRDVGDVRVWKHSQQFVSADVTVVGIGLE